MFSSCSFFFSFLFFLAYIPGKYSYIYFRHSWIKYLAFSEIYVLIFQAFPSSLIVLALEDSRLVPYEIEKHREDRTSFPVVPETLFCFCWFLIGIMVHSNGQVNKILDLKRKEV